MTAASGFASAQGYPSKPIRLVSPYAPGGGTDILARLFGQKMSETLGQQIIIDNRGGAGGTIGTDIAAKSPPDGYTILIGTSSTHTIAPSLYTKLPYDPVRDFAPVTLLASATILLAVHPSVPAKNVKELIAIAKRQPNALSFASSGNGGISHLVGEQFKSMSGIEMLHVPYRGAGPALNDLLPGRVDVMFNNIGAVLPLIESGRLRALAVTTAKRSATAPEVPTMAEAGVKDFVFTQWLALLAPAGTPAAIVTKLNSSLNAALGSNEVRQKFQEQGFEPFITSSEEAGKFLASEVKRYAVLIKSKGIKAE
jgi:tripartite-type tricarboxylate transporter receptor subunit TctC